MIYGSSIVFTRGLEYVVLFFAAGFLSKSDYGELEYYKKVIEVGSSVFAFGFPALIVSYTRSHKSKHYFFLLSLLFVISLAGIIGIFFSFFQLLFLIIPFIFYAIFFNGGITPAYLLVFKGSDYASYYKIVISVVFYSVVFASIYFFNVSAFAYVNVNYVLIPFALLYVFGILYKQKILAGELKRYWGLFRKLLMSSFTLVVSNFANLMFLYTDIFIIKILSKEASIEIANYSFALNIANLLMLIPLTLVQVDIEQLKKDRKYVFVLNKKIIILVSVAAVLLLFFYYIFTNNFFIDFKNTLSVFTIILVAKIFHSMSTLFGTNLLIAKLFKANLIVNLTMLVLNIVISYILYFEYKLIGVAFASVISLLIRYVILLILNRRITPKST